MRRAIRQCQVDEPEDGRDQAERQERDVPPLREVDELLVPGVVRPERHGEGEPERLESAPEGSRDLPAAEPEAPETEASETEAPETEAPATEDLPETDTIPESRTAR